MDQHEDQPEAPPARGAEPGARHRRALEDVLSHGEQGIRSTLDAAPVEALRFEGLERAIRSGAAALTARPEPPASADDPVASEKEGGEGLGAEELEELVALHEAVPVDPAAARAERVHLERAQVLLQMAACGYRGRGSVASAGRVLGLRVDAALNEASSDEVRALLDAAIPDMAETLDEEAFDRWMELAMTFLSRSIQVPVETLGRMAVDASPRGRRLLAPHVIDQYLLLLPRRIPPLDERLFELEPAALEAVWSRLARLRAFGLGLMAPGAFRVGDRFARDLILRLAGSPLASKLAPILTAAFLESMPRDPGARACLLAIRRPTGAQGRVLAAQLADPRATLAGEDERSAASALVDALGALDEERTREPWIEEAVQWLGGRDTRRDADVLLLATRKLLERILGERRRLRSVWARPARRAARAALAALPDPIPERLDHPPHEPEQGPRQQ